MTTLAPNFSERVMINMLLYYTPILVVVGTVGNCLAVCVLFRKDLRNTSSSYYLAALAISDTGFLMSVFIRWLKIFGINIFKQSHFCQAFVYPTVLWGFLSVYCVVAFTVERFVAVQYPFHRHLICTVPRAKMIIIGLTCIGVVLCSPIFWMVIPANPFFGMPACTVPKEWKFWAFVFCIVNTAITFILPFTLIVVLNGLIIKTLRRQAGVRNEMTNRTSHSSGKSSSHRGSNSSTTETNITNMLLIVSSVFLCLNFPSYAMKAYTFSQFTAQKFCTTAEKSQSVLFPNRCEATWIYVGGYSSELIACSGENAVCALHFPLWINTILRWSSLCAFRCECS